MGSYEPIYDQEIHTIDVSEEIRLSGKPPLPMIAEAVAFLQKDGIIVLNNVIDTNHIDALNAKLSPEAFEIANDPDHAFNFGKETQNMDQAPPPTREYMYKDVWCNSIAAAILAAVLGPQPVVHYANGNTALKAAPHARQPVHSDCEFEHSIFFSWGYVCNINLVDTEPKNGSTEFWLGSHHVSGIEAHDPAASIEDLLSIKPAALEARRAHSPPIQARTKKGSMIIRDLRLWHAGMPNLTDEPRVMLAFVVEPAWYEGRAKIKLPLAVKDLIESWKGELQYNVDWVDGEVDHKKITSRDSDFDTGSVSLEKYRKELGSWPKYVPRYY